MAKYNVNQSKGQRLMENIDNVISITRKPTVIPRNKLDAAYKKVQEAQKREKYHIAFSLILIAAVLLAVYMR